MAKFERIPKLNKRHRQQLILALCQAFAAIQKPEEAAKFLTDLLTLQEVEMLAKRLQIAKLLIDGLSYQDIRGELKVGSATIARVNTWLNLQGEGFKLILSRTKQKKKIYEHSLEEIYDPYSWYNVKRRYTKSF